MTKKDIRGSNLKNGDLDSLMHSIVLTVATLTVSAERTEFLVGVWRYRGGSASISKWTGFVGQQIRHIEQ